MPANGTSDTQPEKERMPDSDAVGSDGGNQDVEKDAKSQDDTEGKAVSETPSSPDKQAQSAADGKQPENNRDMPGSDAVGSDGGNQDVEKVAKSQDDTEEKFVSENPDSQDKQVQSAADTQPKTGVFGEKYFDGTGEITALVIGGETIDLTKANEPVSRNHPGLMSDFDKVMVSQNQYKNLIYGAAKLKDGSYTLFVQGQPTEALPEGKAKYQGKVLHFRSRNVTDKTDWLDEGNSYMKTGTFTAEVDFGQKSVNGTINSGDGVYMGTKKFTARIEGSGFKGEWDTKEQGSVEGKFYGHQADEMAGRYDFNKTPGKNDASSDNGFGVFAGKKEANAH
ncbi:transferrin-binding protein-like solute binding protein [Neisseria meningitidis]|uniref:transferrin-binding protein-like solute binding protein n=1 Tax=Neisseria meningitidis TaxID=487 RepID=UPI000C3222BD|nr:transferrin-binding protein-like solute binding protein [Neisseria meningitidis]